MKNTFLLVHVPQSESSLIYAELRVLNSYFFIFAHTFGKKMLINLKIEKLVVSLSSFSLFFSLFFFLNEAIKIFKQFPRFLHPSKIYRGQKSFEHGINILCNKMQINPSNVSRSHVSRFIAFDYDYENGDNKLCV